MKSSFRVMQNPNYAVYFLGQVISFSGTFMQGVALSWLMFEMTHSSYWVGLITFFSQIPAFILGPIGGAVADRVSRRWLLFITEFLFGILAFTLSFFVYKGYSSPTIILGFGVVQGFVSAFELSARYSFVFDLVGKEDVAQASAWNSVLMNISRLTGPALGGIILSRYNAATCFFLNGCSYALIVLSLLFLKTKHTPVLATEKTEIWKDLKQGMKYIWNHRRVRNILLTSTVFCLTTAPITTLLPNYAKMILNGGPQALSYLISAMGAGAMLGALLLVQKGTQKKELWNYSARMFLGCGSSLIAFALSRDLVLSVFICVLIGATMMPIFAVLSSAIQLEISDEYRGRVASLYFMTFLGAVPVGSLIAGMVADYFSSIIAVLCLGGSAILAGLVVWRHDDSKRASRKHKISLA